MSGFFAQVTKYVPGEGRNPREDRLTEIFAAVLSHVDGFANVVAGALLDQPPPIGKVDVQTQVRIASKKSPTDLRIDLQLITSSEIIWVENKHGAPIGVRDGGRTQVHNYLAEIEAGGAVVVLHPRRDRHFSRDAVPSHARRKTWESLNESLREFEGQSSLEQFLLGELQSYLETEGLVDPPMLSSGHIESLTHHSDAIRALTAVFEAASAHVEERWNRASYSGRRGLDLYDMHVGYRRDRIAAESWPNTWWQWGVDINFEADFPGLTVYAGLRGSDDHLRLEDASAIADARSLGFMLFESRSHDRLCRVATLDSVATGDTITEQGMAVGTWVVEAFTALATIHAR